MPDQEDLPSRRLRSGDSEDDDLDFKLERDELAAERVRLQGTRR